MPEARFRPRLCENSLRVSISGVGLPLPVHNESNTARSERSNFRASYLNRVFTQPRPEPVAADQAMARRNTPGSKPLQTGGVISRRRSTPGLLIVSVLSRLLFPSSGYLQRRSTNMSEHRGVATQRIARMLRELEGSANPSRGRATNIFEPATEFRAHSKGRMARHWLLVGNADIHDRQEAVGPTPTST